MSTAPIDGGQRADPLRVAGRIRLLICAVAGLVAGVLGWWLTGHAHYGMLIMTLITSGAFVIWSLVVLWPMSRTDTELHCGQEDLNTVGDDLVVLAILVVSIAIIAVLLLAGTSGNHAVDAALALAAVLAVWTLLHTIYAARYARTYFNAGGGIDFNNEATPCYRDFFYFSFNLGMTYQVSDNAVSSTAIRSLVLKHCLTSYVYGTMVLACTINLVLGLVQ